MLAGAVVAPEGEVGKVCPKLTHLIACRTQLFQEYWPAPATTALPAVPSPDGAGKGSCCYQSGRGDGLSKQGSRLASRPQRGQPAPLSVLRSGGAWHWERPALEGTGSRRARGPHDGRKPAGPPLPGHPGEGGWAGRAFRAPGREGDRPLRRFGSRTSPWSCWGGRMQGPREGRQGHQWMFPLSSPTSSALFWRTEF